MISNELIEWGHKERIFRLLQLDLVKSGQMQLEDAQKQARKRRKSKGLTDGDVIRIMRHIE